MGFSSPVAQKFAAALEGVLLPDAGWISQAISGGGSVHYFRKPHGTSPEFRVIPPACDAIGVLPGEAWADLPPGTILDVFSRQTGKRVGVCDFVKGRFVFPLRVASTDIRFKLRE